MIQASELRIGNWVLGDGQWCRISAVDLVAMDKGRIISDPIPSLPRYLRSAGLITMLPINLQRFRKGTSFYLMKAMGVLVQISATWKI